MSVLTYSHMPNIPILPNSPFEVEALFQTPLRINVDFLQMAAGQAKWRTFYSSKVSQESPSQLVRVQMDPLATGSKLLLTAVFSGAQNTAYQANIKITQNGAQCGQPMPVQGSTGAKYAKYEEIEVTLV